MIYCPEKRYGLSVDLHNKDRIGPTIVIKDKPDRVKIFKKVMEKNGLLNQKKNEYQHKN